MKRLSEVTRKKLIASLVAAFFLVMLIMTFAAPKGNWAILAATILAAIFIGAVALVKGAGDQMFGHLDGRDEVPLTEQERQKLADRYRI